MKHDMTQLVEHVRARADELAIPGVALGITTGAEEWYEGIGVTSVDNPLPIDADTLFCVQSNTKPFVSLTAVRLVEEGLLDLDEPISQIVPGLELASPEMTREVTTRMLLTHRSGLGDKYPECGQGEDALTRFAELMPEVPQVARPGVAYSYSNAGTNLAGHVVACASGVTFEEAVATRMLRPLGMTNSHFLPEYVIYRRHAACHTLDANGPVVYPEWQVSRAHNPSGGLVSSTRDLVKWTRFLCGDGTSPDGTTVLSGASMKEIQAGKYFRRIDADGGYFVCHGGGGIGVYTQAAFAPQAGVGVVVLTNGIKGLEFALHEVPWLLMEKAAGLSRPPKAGERTSVQLTGAELAALAATYTASLEDTEITVVDGELELRRLYRPEAWATIATTPPPPAAPPQRLQMIGPPQGQPARAPDQGPHGVRFARTVSSKWATVQPGADPDEYEFLLDEGGRAWGVRWFGRISSRVETG